MRGSSVLKLDKECWKPHINMSLSKLLVLRKLDQGPVQEEHLRL